MSFSHDDHEHTHDHAHEHTHTHDGTEHQHSHTHAHEHGEHTHDHAHPHDETELHLQDKEMQTLYVLLDHWVEHNVSHEDGFTEWAEKATAFGKNETAEAIKEAITYMEKANEMLKTAKEKMK